MTEHETLINIAVKGSFAQLQEAVKYTRDREAARPIYRELVRLANELARKHGFTRPTREKS